MRKPAVRIGAGQRGGGGDGRSDSCLARRGVQACRLETTPLCSSHVQMRLGDATEVGT